MELKEFLKLRYMFLLSQKEDKNIDHLPTAIRISAKLHELDLIIKFLSDGKIDDIYKIR